MSFDSIIDFLTRFWNENFGKFISHEKWVISHNNVNEMLDWTTICHLEVFFALLTVVFIVLLRHYKLFNWLAKHILIGALLVWIAGVWVYIVGFYNKDVNGLSVVLRSIVSSFRMFVVSHDLARITETMQHNASYMAAFAITHFAAAFISFLFIFKMIGYKIKSSGDILWHKLFHCKKGIVHLFWGINEMSLLLAEDINKEHPSDTIIFVDIDEEYEENSQRKATLSQIIDPITAKNSEIARLNKIKALVAHCYYGPAQLSNDKASDIFGILGLKNIYDIVRKSTKSHFYLLSDDEAKNIAGALNLEQDERLRQLDGNKPTIYVHARKSANNEVLDHYSQYDSDTSRMEVIIKDSAWLSITQLKRDEALPVHCVDVDPDTGLVTSPFTSLIVGFGDTGQEAFKFLYEYATFVGPDLKKSPFKCYAIDEKMNEIAGLVRQKMPAITDELELIQASVNSGLFWEKVDTIINNLNYVVITLNNDTVGLSLAVNLFKYALQHRQDSHSRLNILLRCYNSDNEKKMVEVTDNLNHSIKDENIKIMLFGKEKELFRCDTIIFDSILAEAKEFNRVYKDSKVSAEKQWEINFGNGNIEQLMDSEKLSRYHVIYNINRCIAQNISNSQHSRTKMILMGLGQEDMTDRLERFYQYTQERESNSTKYHCDERDRQLLQNMAMLEHERWIALHKLMGYTYAAKTDHVRKHHQYMCPWEELEEKTQSYDCRVVDTTIKIEYNKRLGNK